MVIGKYHIRGQADTESIATNESHNNVQITEAISSNFKAMLDLFFSREKKNLSY
jgi:hypothetical protein